MALIAYYNHNTPCVVITPNLFLHFATYIGPQTKHIQFFDPTIAVYSNSPPYFQKYWSPILRELLWGFHYHDQLYFSN